MAVAVFFGAHADDIELGAGGTCAKLCAAGFDVRIVVATDEINPAIASTRRNEAIAAAAILGVPPARVHFLGLPDGHFRCNGNTVAQIRTLFSALDLCPDVVFTHTEADSHQDHVELTRIVKAAFRRLAIFKYRVRNSAIPSHFEPTISSDISGYGNLKSAALCQHKSQIALRRVGELAREHSEGFELEIQEGAANYCPILDHVNDAPFSRFWMPLCANGAVTVIAQAAQPLRSYNPVCRGAPSDLQLVTRLQEELLKVMHTRLIVQPFHPISVEEGDEAKLDALPIGASLILGGPFVNQVAQAFCNRIAPLRFRFDPASTEYLIDTHTGTVFEPMFKSLNETTFELTRDYGLLTIGRMNNVEPKGEESLVIAAMGVHAPGTAAVLSCLLLPEHITRIVDDARRVIEGGAECAQWVIPCDANGVPLVSEIQTHVEAARLPQSQPKKQQWAKRIALAS
jgi:LmbE family N-acetylglucosaminyl deacetylase